MTALFHYVRSRRRTALNVLGGMLILPAWLWVFATLGAGKAGTAKFMDVATTAVGVIEGLMALWVLWLLTHPDHFEITVTPERFEVHHPIFAEWTFSMAPASITRIEHVADIDGFTRIDVHTRAGERRPLCKNYNYSRKRLYDALRAANPAIRFPDNIDRFERSPAA